MIKTYSDYEKLEKLLKDSKKIVFVNGNQATFVDIDVLLLNVLCGADNVKRFYNVGNKIYLQTIA